MSGLPAGVKSLEEASAENTAEFFIALYDYTAGSESELSFSAGDVLAIYDRSGEWWYAQNNFEVCGWIPPSYLDIENPVSFDEVYSQYLEDSVHSDSIVKGGSSEKVDLILKLESTDAENPVKLEPTEAENPVKLESIEAENPVKLEPTEAENPVKLESTEAEKPIITGPDGHPSPLNETEQSTASNEVGSAPGSPMLADLLSFPKRVLSSESDADMDEQFTSKMNDWCQTTNKALQETVTSSKVEEPSEERGKENDNQEKIDEIIIVREEASNDAQNNEPVEKTNMEIIEPVIADAIATVTKKICTNDADVEGYADDFEKETIDISAVKDTKQMNEFAYTDDFEKETIDISAVKDTKQIDEFAYTEEFEKEEVDDRPQIEKQAKELVTEIIERAVLKSISAEHAKFYVQDSLSKVVPRAVDKIINMQYRAAHARQLTRTSKIICPNELNSLLIYYIIVYS